MDFPRISVVIPAYNTESYIDECVNSIQRQTFQDFEIIIINDGSTDGTLNCIERLAALDTRIRFYNSENHGQGYQRNFALSEAQGEYVLFLDADDFLEPHALELAFNRAVEDSSDLVFFNWKYYNNKTQRYSFLNKELFSDQRLLYGDDCLRILSSKAYYSVTRLYKKTFLLDNAILYGEGYIYEDLIFIVKSAVKARCISVIDSPLYNIRINPTSTTRTNLCTDQHYQGYIKACTACFEVLRETDCAAKYYFYAYIFGRYFVYYRTRIPVHMQKSFTEEFIKLISNEDIKPIPFSGDTSVRFLLKLRAVKSKRLYLFFALHLYFIKIRPHLRKLKKSVRRYKLRLKSFAKHLASIPKVRGEVIDKNLYLPKYRAAIKKPLLSNTILFLGFDFRYTGNSRYLYEQILTLKTDDIAVYFATASKSVSDEHRLIPYSESFYDILATANILIFESWTNPSFAKRDNALWIQLWHGTPLKKMLFDSNEADIIRGNPNHKLQKYADIRKWDIFVTDHPNVNRFFETSFLLKEKNFLSCGYPRVRFLLDNISDTAKKNVIKDMLKVPVDKKVVLYLPTWRDYNYSSGTEDTGYLLDVPALKDRLGTDYFIIDKNHTYLSNHISANFGDFANAETQELLLIADYLITDYSSVLFDAFAADIPVVLYVNDFKKYQASRGVYPELWNQLTDFVCENIDAVAAMILTYQPSECYTRIKSEFCFCNRTDSLVNSMFRHLVQGYNKRHTLAVFGTGEYDTGLCRLLQAADRFSDTLTAAVIRPSVFPLEKTAEFEETVLSSGYIDAVIHPTVEELPKLVTQRNIFTVVTTKELCPSIYSSLAALCRILYFDKKENRLKDGLLCDDDEVPLSQLF